MYVLCPNVWSAKKNVYSVLRGWNVQSTWSMTSICVSLCFLLGRAVDCWKWAIEVTHSYYAGVLFHLVLQSWKMELKLNTKDRHSYKDPRVEEQSPVPRYFLHSSLWVTGRAAKPEGSVQLAFRSPAHLLSFVMCGPYWMQGCWFCVNCVDPGVMPFSTEMKW